MIAKTIKRQISRAARWWLKRYPVPSKYIEVRVPPMRTRGAAVHIDVQATSRGWGATAVAASIVQALRANGFRVAADLQSVTRSEAITIEHPGTVPPRDEIDRRLIMIRTLPPADGAGN